MRDSEDRAHEARPTPEVPLPSGVAFYEMVTAASGRERIGSQRRTDATAVGGRFDSLSAWAARNGLRVRRALSRGGAQGAGFARPSTSTLALSRPSTVVH